MKIIITISLLIFFAHKHADANHANLLLMKDIDYLYAKNHGIEEIKPFGISLGEELPEEMRDLLKKTSLSSNYVLTINTDESSLNYSGSYISNPNKFLPEIRIYTEPPPDYKVIRLVASYSAVTQLDEKPLFALHKLFAYLGKWTELSKKAALTSIENYIFDSSRVLYALCRKYGYNDNDVEGDSLEEWCERQISKEFKHESYDFNNVYSWKYYEGFNLCYVVELKLSGRIGRRDSLERSVVYTNYKRKISNNHDEGL